MTAFAEVDTVLEPWVTAHGRHLFREFAGQEARFFYWSSASGECFQISLDAPHDGSLVVHAWTIETRDDREAHREWTTSIRTLFDTLDAAFAQIQAWAA